MAYFSNPMTAIDITFTVETVTNEMIGFDSSPQDSLSYTTIDFAWTYSTADGALAIYENGVKIANYGSYIPATTVLRMTYDGTNVKYYKDGSVQRTVANTGNLYITSVYNEVGAQTTITLTAAAQQRYTSDCQLSCGDTHLTNMTILLSAMNGHVSYTNGKYRLYAGAYDSPTVTIGPDDVMDDIELSSHPSGADVYNFVTGTFFDEDRNWKQSTFPSQTQLTYQADDGALYQLNVDMKATRQNYRAQRMAIMILNQSRNNITINFSALSPNAINIGEWETFYLTLPEYGYSSQVFRCLEWTFNCATGLISMTARIESSSSYADPDISDYTDPVSNQPTFAQTELPQTPTGLTLTGFPTYIKLVPTLAQPLRKNEIVQVFENTSSSPFSGATLIDYGAKSTFDIPKRDTTTRYYWVNCKLNGQVSNTYPASTGQAGVADLNQTNDLASNAATDTNVATLASSTTNFTSSGIATIDDCSINYTNSTSSAITLDISYSITVTLTSNNLTTTIDSATIYWVGTDNTASTTLGEAGAAQTYFVGPYTNTSATKLKTYVDSISVPAGHNVTIKIQTKALVLVGGGGPYNMDVKREQATLLVFAIKR